MTKKWPKKNRLATLYSKTATF